MSIATCITSPYSPNLCPQLSIATSTSPCSRYYCPPQMSLTFQYVQKCPLQHDATPCNAYYRVPQMSMTIIMCTNVHCNILQVPELLTIIPNVHYNILQVLAVLTIIPQCPLKHNKCYWCSLSIHLKFIEAQ
jgi:hypothetical protein